jgi:hypothetical protein
MTASAWKQRLGNCLIPLEAADWGAQGVTQVTEAAHCVQKA